MSAFIYQGKAPQVVIKHCLEYSKQNMLTLDILSDDEDEENKQQQQPPIMEKNYMKIKLKRSDNVIYQNKLKMENGKEKDEEEKGINLNDTTDLNICAKCKIPQLNTLRLNMKEEKCQHFYCHFCIENKINMALNNGKFFFK
jgi:hypothetical protein